MLNTTVIYNELKLVLDFKIEILSWDRMLKLTLLFKYFKTVEVYHIWLPVNNDLND